MVIGAALGRRARVHVDLGPGHLADERVPRPGVLRRGAGGDRSTCSAPGPSTGMPTRTQQGDLLLCAYASHGDTRHICLYPADPREAFEFAVQAFDLAERFQTPVFVLTDLDIGMNDWMVPKLTWDDSYRPDRGKVLSAEQLEQVTNFYRYLDVDGDGVPYRTLPGDPPEGGVLHARLGPQPLRRLHRGPRRVHGRRRPHRAQDSERATRAARAHRPHAAGSEARAASRSAPAMRPASKRSTCSPQEGIAVDYMRVRGFPFGDEVGAFLEAHEVNFVVEQNRDAQLRSLLMLDTGVPPGEARVGALLRRVPDERPPRDYRGEGEAGEGGMTYITKPKIHHPALQKNAIGLTRRDYEGADHDAVRRLRARFDHRRHHPGVLGARRSRRTRWPSCPASAARRRRRPTSCARRTGSTASTGACRRS